MRRSSDLTATVSNWIPQLLHWRPGTHTGASADQCSTTQGPAWKPASQLPNQEAHSAFSARGSQAGNPIGVVLLQVRWTITGHCRAGDRPPDCCGQRRRKGRPERVDSSALLLRGDYVRILGRPTVVGGAPCSACSLGMSHKGRKCSDCSPYIPRGKRG